MASNRLYGPSGAPGAPALTLNTSGATAAVLPAQLSNALTTEQVIPSPSLPAIPLQVQIPSGSALEQRPFKLVASGYISAAAAENVTVKLYSGSSLVVANNTLLGSSGAIAYAAAGKAPFFAEAELVYDSVSGKLDGTVKFFVNHTLVGEVAVSNTVTGIANSNNPVAEFCMTVTFSVANAANLINVQEFAINF